MRIQKILCPVDFFAASQSAIDYAAALARVFHARIILLHVVEPFAPWASNVPIDTSELTRTVTDRSIKELEKISAQLKAARVESEVAVRIGEVDLEIQSIIGKRKADFVVMGTHGRRGLEKFFLGSTTERLLRKLQVPLLTVRNSNPQADIHIRNILVATDFSDGTNEAVNFALSLAKATRANVTLLHILNDIDADISGRYRDRLIQSIRQEMDSLVPTALRKTCNVSTRVETGRPIRRILPILEEEKFDLIVMNIHGRSIMDRITTGSIAEKVVRTSSVPVLVIPAAK